MLDDGVCPRPEPGAQGRGQPVSVLGVAMELLPLVLIRTAGLVQDLPGHHHLAHVVQQRSPMQLVPLLIGEIHLVGQQVRVRPDSLGVATRPGIVGVQQSHQLEDLLGSTSGLVVHPVGTNLVQSLLQVSDRARAEGNAKARRSLVGEDHGQLEESGEGQEATGLSVHDEEHARGDHEDGHPPEDDGDDPARVGHHRAEDDGGEDGGGDRYGGDKHAQQPGLHGTSLPATLAGVGSPSHSNPSVFNVDVRRRGLKALFTPSGRRLPCMAHPD